MEDELIANLTQRLLQYEPEGDYVRGSIRASSVGNCLRQTYYKMKETPPDEDVVSLLSKDKFVMGFGDLWESYIGKLFSELGIPHHKQPIFNAIHNVSGTTDPIITVNEQIIITECKLTHNDHFQILYENAKRGIQPQEYYSQLQTYLFLLPKTDFGMFIIGNRSWRRKDRLPPFFLQECERDHEWYKKNFGLRIPLLNGHLKDNTLPNREYFDKDKFPCSYCQFINRCWSEE